MALETFDYRTPKAGSYNRKVRSTGLINRTTLSTYTGGMSGYIISQGNPRPYVTGGDFDVTKTTSDRGYLTGSHTDSLYEHIYDMFAVGVNTTYAGPALSSTSTVNDVLAQTNPSAPIVDLPVFIAELREVPSLILFEGRTLIKKIAEGNLKWEFAWKPLISDLRGLLDFQGAVDRRVKHLHHMYKRGGARFERTVGLIYGHGADSLRTILPNGIGNVRERGVYYHRRWISVSWVPTYDPREGIPPVSEIRRKAFSAVLGLTIDPATVWELLPWSWLADWFSDVGSYLSAQRNIVGFKPGICYTMNHRIDDQGSYFQGLRSGYEGSTPPRWRQESKRRTASSIGLPTVQASLLTRRQLGILGSLAILRR